MQIFYPQVSLLLIMNVFTKRSWLLTVQHTASLVRAYQPSHSWEVSKFSLYRTEYLWGRQGSTSNLYALLSCIMSSKFSLLRISPYENIMGFGSRRKSWTPT
jgi:hypothetical protein